MIHKIKTTEHLLEFCREVLEEHDTLMTAFDRVRGDATLLAPWMRSHSTRMLNTSIRAALAHSITQALTARQMNFSQIRTWAEHNLLTPRDPVSRSPSVSSNLADDCASEFYRELTRLMVKAS